jgi:hypothetical protein
LAGVADESVRVHELREAQAKAEQLFAAVDDRGLIAPGRGERAVSDQISTATGGREVR